MLPPLSQTPSNSASSSSIQSAVIACIRLDFSDLKVFELVRNQYRDLGIQFERAIAIQPSHSAFVTRFTPVLMPVADRSSMVIHFKTSKQIVGGRVTGARQIKATAFSLENYVLMHQRVGVPRYLQPPPESVEQFPEYRLELHAAGITRVELSSDAPFILHLFYCG